MLPPWKQHCKGAMSQEAGAASEPQEVQQLQGQRTNE